MHVSPDTIIDGRYRVLKRLGVGGMAEVWCAEDEVLGRRVALKLLGGRYATDPEFRERFRREAQAAAGLTHPNIVGVFDRSEWDGTPYIAMELVDGQTLKDLVRERGPMPPHIAVGLTEQILRALAYAHRRGIVHRDIKPQNVILDPEGEAKVADFGIARAGNSEMTQTGSIVGTVQYLSAEQANGQPRRGSCARASRPHSRRSSCARWRRTRTGASRAPRSSSPRSSRRAASRSARWSSTTCPRSGSRRRSAPAAGCGRSPRS